MPQVNDTLRFDEVENSHFDNFLGTIDTFDDLFDEDDMKIFVPSPEEIQSGHLNSPDTSFSSNEFARSSSNDFFLGQMINDEAKMEAHKLFEYDVCAPPPVASNAMPETGCHVDIHPEPTWRQQPEQKQMQYHPNPFIAQPCNVPNFFPPHGGYIQAHLQQKTIGVPVLMHMAGQQPLAAESQAEQKVVRRTCSFPYCPNRIVQGGRCISHGARRKTCSHPGCDKHVKKAGLCSAHGPARKRCEHEVCTKVAVQGGKCIAHGAKKRRCYIEDCTKQGILNGMCKKHYDATHGVAKVHGPRKKTKVYNGNAYYCA